MDQSVNNHNVSMRGNSSSRIALIVFSIVGGALGWWASFRLFLDYIESLKDTDFVPSCNLSDVVSCAQNFGSNYGSTFGFSNTILGLSLFVIPIVLGTLLLAQYASNNSFTLPKWVLVGYSVGLLGAVAFITYLQWASFTQIYTLCLYCLLIWTVVIPLFWSSVSNAIDPSTVLGNSALSRIKRIIANNWWFIAFIHYIAVLVFGEVSIGAVRELFSALL